MKENQINNSFLKMVRWRILVTLEAGRPAPVSEHLLMQVLNDTDCASMPFSVRREVDFLEIIGLLEIVDKTKSPWRMKLTAEGVKVVQGLVDTPKGISKPDWDT